jgi:hypothetical protein
MCWKAPEAKAKQGVRHGLSSLLAGAVCLGICLRSAPRARAEDVLGYRHEIYQEDGGRIGVQTDSVLIDTPLTSWLTLKGQAVHDAISGASPTGSPPPSKIKFVPASLGGPTGPFSSSVPLEYLDDERYAGSFSPTLSLGPHQVTPEFSYSTEHDYISYGAALTYALSLNEKNTVLNLGVSHDFDTVLPKGFLAKASPKNTDVGLVGVNQLLGPRTVLAANFSYANEHGYLNDQYKGVLFASDLQLDPADPALEPEKRPRHRDRYVTVVSLTQEVKPLHASVEGSYRFYDDSYGIFAHTLDLAWYQKLGKYVVVSPMLRYYYQTAADFYATQFGDRRDPPTYYSADYRLSELESFTAGLSVNWKIRSWLTIDVAYKRYIMMGLDGTTSQTAYPSANVFTIGARLWF